MALLSLRRNVYPGGTVYSTYTQAPAPWIMKIGKLAGVTKTLPHGAMTPPPLLCLALNHNYNQPANHPIIHPDQPAEPTAVSAVLLMPNIRQSQAGRAATTFLLSGFCERERERGRERGREGERRDNLFPANSAFCLNQLTI